MVSRYTRALREEPKLRMYVLGALVDDVGTAVSAWAGQLMFVALMTDQHARAKLMVPAMACFLAGTVVGGPLADWASRGSSAYLARWRWRVVVWGRVVETLALALLIYGIANKPTLASVAPYTFVSAFMKTTMRPSRDAFRVDLLTRGEPQVADDGTPMRDENGAPRIYKTHLLSFDSITTFLKATSVLAGLLLGAKILQVAHGHYVPLFLVDVATNVVFVAFIAFGCHPERRASELKLSELFADPDPPPPLSARAASAKRSLVVESLKEVAVSFREVTRFAARREQRPLLCIIFGSLIFEWVYEFYSGAMLVKHTLHGTDEQYRQIEIAWNFAWVAAFALLPMLARWVKSLGRMFAVTMFVDGVVIAIIGVMCARGAGALVSVAVMLGLDHVLTTGSSQLADLARNSASSAALRGRLSAVYAFAAIIGDIFAEIGSTRLSDAYGTGGMLVRVGITQTIVIALLVVLGGERFWRYGLRVKANAAPDEVVTLSKLAA